MAMIAMTTSNCDQSEATLGLWGLRIIHRKKLVQIEIGQNLAFAPSINQTSTRVGLAVGSWRLAVRKEFPKRKPKLLVQVGVEATRRGRFRRSH